MKEHWQGTPEVPTREPAIGRELNRLFGEIENLGEALSSLADRLVPVRNESQPKREANNTPANPQECQVSEQISSASYRLTALREKINLIHGELEI